MRPNTSLDHNTIKALQELESILLLLNKLKTSEAKLKMLKSYFRYIKDERENSSFLWPFIRDKHTLSNENRQFDNIDFETINENDAENIVNSLNGIYVDAKKQNQNYLPSDGVNYDVLSSVNKANQRKGKLHKKVLQVAKVPNINDLYWQITGERSKELNEGYSLVKTMLAITSK